MNLYNIAKQRELFFNTLILCSDEESIDKYLYVASSSSVTVFLFKEDVIVWLHPRPSSWVYI